MKWIKVTDTLPDKNCQVLAYKYNGRIVHMIYKEAIDSIDRRFQAENNYGEWVDQHFQVTHWMPLPEPPKD